MKRKANTYGYRAPHNKREKGGMRTDSYRGLIRFNIQIKYIVSPLNHRNELYFDNHRWT
jgi:hypothetical protein